MKKSLLTLAFGTFGLGIAEFVMMGILPLVARDFGVSIPRAGQLISAYALGVCIGAPLTVMVARKFPLKNILLALVSIYTLGNLLTAFAPNYPLMFAMRLLSGLPHGAFFGVGSIVAEKLADKGKKAQALALMISGMTVANLMGVPLGTYLGAQLTWRLIFVITGLWGLVNLVAIYRWLPQIPAMPDNGLRGQFGFLRHSAPWLLVGATAFANGGIFALYSYVNPLMTVEAGFSENAMSWIMILCGLSMVAGNLTGGRLADRFTMPYLLATIYSVGVLVLLAIFVAARIPAVSLPMLLLVSGCLFAVSSPMQLLILQNSRGGEMMGAAMLQIAFNFGNAVGAWSGGMAIDSQKNFHITALVGAGFLLVSLGLILYFAWTQRRQPAPCLAKNNPNKLPGSRR